MLTPNMSVRSENFKSLAGDDVYAEALRVPKADVRESMSPDDCPSDQKFLE